MNRLYIFLSIVLAVLLFLPQMLNNYWLEIFILIFYYAYLGQCWNILTGYTGNISLGHALYVGIGAYTSTRLAIVFGLTPWAGMSIEIILRPIIGGMGTVLGPIVGSFLITLPAEWTRAYLSEVGRPGLHMVIYGFVLIFAVFFSPGGSCLI